MKPGMVHIAKLEALLLAFGLVILALARWCGPFLGRGFGLRDWDRHVAVRAWVVVPAAILTSLLVPAFVAQVVASGSGFHRPDEHSTLGLIVWTSVHAGVSEELLVLMLPLCVMELFRVRHWWVVYVVGGGAAGELPHRLRVGCACVTAVGDRDGVAVSPLPRRSCRSSRCTPSSISGYSFRGRWTSPALHGGSSWVWS